MYLPRIDSHGGEHGSFTAFRSPAADVHYCAVCAKTKRHHLVDGRIVTVPVIVTDTSGKAVHGLKQEDFSVAENGKPQRIASFEEVTAQKRPVRSISQQNGIYTNRVETDNAFALGSWLSTS